MANLGISNASYYTDRFITKLNKEVDHSVNRLSTARKDVSASDIASLKSMDYTFRLIGHEWCDAIPKKFRNYQLQIQFSVWKLQAVEDL